MKSPVQMALLLMALVCALLHTFDVRTNRVNLGWLGVSFFLLAQCMAVL